MGTGELPIFSSLMASQGCWTKGICCHHHSNLEKQLPRSQEEGPASLGRFTLACLFILFPFPLLSVETLQDPAQIHLFHKVSSITFEKSSDLLLWTTSSNACLSAEFHLQRGLWQWRYWKWFCARLVLCETTAILINNIVKHFHSFMLLWEPLYLPFSHSTTPLGHSGFFPVNPLTS